ncbi:MAG: N-acetylmuramoyl-L-alanine amidase [Ramlibacter sp.]
MHGARTIQFLVMGALLPLPLMALAEDNTLILGYCGPAPPNSWFQFSSSTVPAVQSQLISTLTARAFSSYGIAVARYTADYITPTGCSGQITPKPSTYCTNPLDCTAQIDGLVQITCNGQSSTPVLNTFAIERGGCTIAAAPNPSPKKVVVVDPGHGFSCPAKGMAIGAIGATDFASNDPPAGRLREDDLTMAIAREVQRLASSKYEVVLTKTSANACPDFIDRGQTAKRASANVFVSIHVDKPNSIPFDLLGNGSLGIYNSQKPESKALAELMAGAVSLNLQVNSRGSKIDDTLAVLKPSVTPMPAVIIESARLSGDDEKKLHAAGSATRIATGIKAALDTFLGN